MTAEDIRRDPNAPDQTSTATTETEQIGRFRISVVRGEPTPESEELWNGRADALARWLIAQWQLRQVTAESREQESVR
jgi:hypothetical protein